MTKLDAMQNRIFHVADALDDALDVIDTMDPGIEWDIHVPEFQLGPLGDEAEAIVADADRFTGFLIESALKRVKEACVILSDVESYATSSTSKVVLQGDDYYELCRAARISRRLARKLTRLTCSPPGIEVDRDELEMAERVAG